jgi:hypothetical protein
LKQLTPKDKRILRTGFESKMPHPYVQSLCSNKNPITVLLQYMMQLSWTPKLGSGRWQIMIPSHRIQWTNIRIEGS